MSLKVTFSNPSLISQGRLNDRMSIEIKNPSFFTSELSGEMFDVEDPENQKLGSDGLSLGE